MHLTLLTTLDHKSKKKLAFTIFVLTYFCSFQNLGLQVQYNADHDLPLHLRLLRTLAFLSTGDVINGFNVLSQDIRNNFNADADDLLDYFEDKYTAKFRQNSPHSNSIFAIEILNM